MITAWLGAFVFTQAVEAPIYARALRSRPQRWLWAVGASALTHPIVFFVVPRAWPGGYWSGVAIAEAFAVAAEAAYLTALGVPLSLAWALLANAASAGLGLASRAAFGWP